MFGGLCSRLGLDPVQTPIPFENFRSPTRLGRDHLVATLRSHQFQGEGRPGWVVE